MNGILSLGGIEIRRIENNLYCYSIFNSLNLPPSIIPIKNIKEIYFYVGPFHSYENHQQLVIKTRRTSLNNHVYHNLHVSNCVSLTELETDIFIKEIKNMIK